MTDQPNDSDQPHAFDQPRPVDQPHSFDQSRPTDQQYGSDQPLTGYPQPYLLGADPGAPRYPYQSTDPSSTVTGGPYGAPIPPAPPVTPPADAAGRGQQVWGARPAAPVDAGAQPARKGMSNLAKTLTGVGVAAVIAVGGTVAISSAGADNTAAASTVQPAGMGGYLPDGGAATGLDGRTGRSGGFGGAGSMAALSLLGSALHGDFVVAGGSGTVTERLQRGAVRAISDASVTVQSTDDFTGTYALPSGFDAGSIAAGTQVTVIATVDGSTATVTSLTASETATTGTFPGQGGMGQDGTGQGGFGPGSGGNGQGAPATSSSAAPTI